MNSQTGVRSQGLGEARATDSGIDSARPLAVEMTSSSSVICSPETKAGSVSTHDGPVDHRVASRRTPREKRRSSAVSARIETVVTAR